VAFQLATSNVGENGGAQAVNAVLTTAAGNTLENAAVFRVTAANGSAESADYDSGAFPKTITFAAGSGNGAQGANFVPVSDTFVEGNETVNLSLAMVSGVATLGAQTTHQVTIQDADTATVAFQLATSNAPEDGGPRTIAVSLNTAAGNTLENEVFVQISASNGSAESGDYDSGAFPKTITFAVGSGNSATANTTITPTSDTVIEGDETVTLTLSVTSGVATLGAQPTQQLTIIDADTATVAFVVQSQSIGEQAGAPLNVAVQ
jgi:hypothetical protein